MKRAVLAYAAVLIAAGGTALADAPGRHGDRGWERGGDRGGERAQRWSSGREGRREARDWRHGDGWRHGWGGAYYAPRRWVYGPARPYYYSAAPAYYYAAPRIWYPDCP